jgi:UDP-glucuronate 4-epimerase
MNVLVTGAAGFIGGAISLALMQRGETVTGVDNLSDYYDVSLKEARLARMAGPNWRGSNPGQIGSPASSSAPANKSSGTGTFRFKQLDLANREGVAELFGTAAFDRVVHLAAQPGVRYSIDHPHAYIDSNIVGFINVLEGCRHHDIEHLVYASSSSVYGANEKMPYAVGDTVDHPVSLYAATKKSNELMAHAYAHLYGLPATGLRFFTVYGPWGRPDMAPVLFTRAILAGEPIKLFNYGKHRRDFTYIDDIVEGVLRVLDHPATPDPQWNGLDPDPGSSSAPWRLYNIGNSQPVDLARFIEVLENALGKKAKKELLPLQPGDVPDTYADVQRLVDDIGYQPATSLEEGIAQFVAWYREYYL